MAFLFDILPSKERRLANARDRDRAQRDRLADACREKEAELRKAQTDLARTTSPAERAWRTEQVEEITTELDALNAQRNALSQRVKGLGTVIGALTQTATLSRPGLTEVEVDAVAVGFELARDGMAGTNAALDDLRTTVSPRPVAASHPAQPAQKLTVPGADRKRTRTEQPIATPEDLEVLELKE